MGRKEELNMKTFIIKYYLTESAYKIGCAAFTETIKSDRNYVIALAQSKIKNSNFKFYDIQEQ